MIHLLKVLLSSDFMPHGGCYLWTPGLVWLHVVSDTLIGLSYVAISGMLAYMVYQGRKLIPFHAMFLAFGLFIVACGCTHLMEVLTVWIPVYWLSGLVKAITAAASVATAAALPTVIPVALGMLRAARVSEERREKLEAAHEELNRLYAQLKDFDDMKTQFFSNVSHELRTPLALILGPTETLLTDPSRPDAERRQLEVVDRNARTLLRHVNDLLDVSKLEAGKLDVHYAREDLAHLLRLTASHFDALAGDRRISYTVDAPESLPAEIDPEKVERILLNLLSNAFKFTPLSGSVRCALTTAQAPPRDATDGSGAMQDVAVFTVADSGPGIPDELRERVFERFHQIEAGSTRRFGGTGLGLAIARDFATLHGGTLTVTDAPEGGAAFTLTLPLRAPEGATVDASPRPEDLPVEELARQSIEELRPPERIPAAQPAVTAKETGEKPLVLVVEDNQEMARFLAEALSDTFRVETASDGEEGLAKAERLHPDLILTDVMMPRMSGDQLVRAVRQRDELDGVPIVVLTARVDDELRVQLLHEGAQDYVMKPFRAEELRARVTNLVAMKRARDLLRRELQTQSGDLELLAREVSRRDRDQQALLESLRTALEEAERASRVKTNFLRMVSHELRNPLNAMQLQLQLLQRVGDGAMPPRQRDIVNKISNSSTRLLSLIESLLEHARIESGQIATRIQRVDLAQEAHATLEEWRPQADQKGLSLDLLPPAGALPPLHSDPRLVHLILTNLVGNAIKFTEQGGVSVSLAYEGGQHRILVRDTGPGIPADRREQVFQPFEHLEPVRNKHTPGVGLGLALVREMVGALNGTVDLESVEGEGSTFIVTLPSAEPAETKGAEPQEAGK